MLNKTPNGVQILARFVTEPALDDLDGEERESGYVLAYAPEGVLPYVTWNYVASPDDPDIYFWGHYFESRDEAFADLFRRTGFGKVEALS